MFGPARPLAGPADGSPGGMLHEGWDLGHMSTPRLPLESLPHGAFTPPALAELLPELLLRARVGLTRLSARVAAQGVRAERRPLGEGHGSCKYPATGRLAGPCTLWTAAGYGPGWIAPGRVQWVRTACAPPPAR